MKKTKKNGKTKTKKDPHSSPEFEQWYRSLPAQETPGVDGGRKALASTAFWLLRKARPAEDLEYPEGHRPLQVLYEAAGSLLKALEAQSETWRDFLNFAQAGQTYNNALAEHTLSLDGKPLEKALRADNRAIALSGWVDSRIKGRERKTRNPRRPTQPVLDPETESGPEVALSRIEETLPLSAQGRVDGDRAIKLIRKPLSVAGRLRKRLLYAADRESAGRLQRNAANSQSLGQEAGEWAKQHLGSVDLSRLLKARGRFCQDDFRPLAAFARDPKRSMEEVARSLQISVSEADRRLRASLRKLVDQVPDRLTYPRIVAALRGAGASRAQDDIPESVQRAAIDYHKHETLTEQQVRELEEHQRRQELRRLMGAEQKWEDGNGE